ncbi:MAG: YfhO family protein, partial [Verrucomicrobiales bacterium]|nr:YfhO family protein [Verrucomicrobiales bacterium]
KRFRIALQFHIAPKPGVARPTRYEEITAVINTNGPFAVFEFGGALPRAKLFNQWQVCTNDASALREWVEQRRKVLPAEWGMALAGQTATDQATLRHMAEGEFDPHQTVLMAEPPPLPSSTNGPAGDVRYESYAPKRIVLRARAKRPAVLLLNDKYDPNWRVWVDGQPAPLLRANFIMRAVALPAGEHTVEFRFEPPTTYLYVSLAALGLGAVLLALMILMPGRTR